MKKKKLKKKLEKERKKRKALKRKLKWEQRLRRFGHGRWRCTNCGQMVSAASVKQSFGFCKRCNARRLVRRDPSM